MTRRIVDTPEDFQRACDRAEPGDLILVRGGLYDRPTRLAGRGQSDAAPITIRGAGGRIRCGQRPDPKTGGGDPAKDAPAKPTAQDFALLQIDSCRNVVVEGLSVTECWPAILWIKDTSRLAIRGCDLEGGTFAIYVNGKRGTVRDLRIENNRWRQDASLDHKLWSLIRWEHAHGGEGFDGRHRYFNGAFLGGKGVDGDVLVRSNRIEDAYNGIRLKAPGTIPEDGRTNADVHVVDNDFLRIRDNPIEPEVYALDWVIRHNRFVDCHSWFSFDGTGGGYWYVYGNTGRFLSRQGLPRHRRHTMGRVMKLSYDEDGKAGERSVTPSFPWYVFNNSFHLRCPLIGGSDPGDPAPGMPRESFDFTDNLTVFNNAFEWGDPAAHRRGVCERTDMVMNFDWARSRTVLFDFNLSNRSDYVGFVRPTGSSNEANGLTVPGRLFRDGRGGDFRLADGSPGRGSADLRALAASPGRSLAIHAPAGGLDRGARQGEGWVRVDGLE